MIFLNEDTQYISSDNDSATKEMDLLIEEEGIVIEAFDGDEIGAMEIVLEMETSWNSLNADMALIEHRSIVNEDVEILNEGVKDFFKKIAEWFKKIWAGIVNFFKKAWNWLTSFLKNKEKWWNDNKDKVKAKSVEVKVWPAITKGVNWKAIEALIKSLVVISTTDATSADASIKKLEDTKTEDVKSDILGGSEKSKQTVTVENVTNALTGSTKALASLKASHNVQAAIARKGIKIAEAGKKVGEKVDADVMDNKKQIEVLKKGLQEAKRIDAVIIKSASAIISNAAMAGRSLLAGKAESGDSDKK